MDPAKVYIDQWSNFANNESVLKSNTWSNDAPGTPPLSPNVPDDEVLVTQLPVFSYISGTANLSAVNLSANLSAANLSAVNLSANLSAAAANSSWINGNAAGAQNLPAENFAQSSVPTPSSCTRMPVHVPGAPQHPPPDCCLASVNRPSSIALNRFGQSFHQGYGDFAQVCTFYKYNIL